MNYDYNDSFELKPTYCSVCNNELFFSFAGYWTCGEDSHKKSPDL